MRLVALSILALSFPTPPAPALAESGAFPICSNGKRIQCVVDGDTFWKDGKKYRLKDIDAPEIADRAKCREEYLAAVTTAYQLQRMLESGIVSMKFFGIGRYGRTLVRVETQMGDIGSALLNANLAQPFGRFAARAPWC